MKLRDVSGTVLALFIEAEDRKWESEKTVPLLP